MDFWSLVLIFPSKMLCSSARSPQIFLRSAVLAKYYPRMTEARAYHLYIAFFYSLGIAAAAFALFEEVRGSCNCSLTLGLFEFESH